MRRQVARFGSKPFVIQAISRIIVVLPEEHVRLIQRAKEHELSGEKASVELFGNFFFPGRPFRRGLRPAQDSFCPKALAICIHVCRVRGTYCTFASRWRNKRHLRQLSCRLCHGSCCRHWGVGSLRSRNGSQRKFSAGVHFRVRDWRGDGELCLCRSPRISDLSKDVLWRLLDALLMRLSLPKLRDDAKRASTRDWGTFWTS